MKNKSYPGRTLLLSWGSRKPFKYSKEENSWTLQLFWITIQYVKQDLNELLDSYHTMLMDRIKELEKKLYG